MDMEEDQHQVQQMWGVLKVLTKEEDENSQPQSKRQKAEHTPNKGKGKGKTRRTQTSTPATEDLTHIVKTLARLSLRHEDALRGLAMEQDYMLFLSLGPGSIMVKMMQATEDWHLTEPKDRALPLKIKVLRTLLEELLNRVRKLQAARPEEELVQTLLKFQYLTLGENANDLRFSFMQWNPEKKTLETDTDRQALPMNHVLNQLTKILALLQQHALIIRFGALRPNAQIQQSLNHAQSAQPQVIPWRLTLAMTHRQSAEMHAIWQELAHSGVWQLILGRMRQATHHRTPLASHLGRLLENM